MSSDTMAVVNPATGAEIARVPIASAAEIDRVMALAQHAFATWKQVPVASRATIQKSCAAALRHHAKALAEILHGELGRPMAGCLQEMARAADLLDVYADEGVKLETSVYGENARAVREPVGVVVAITPFNYPINLLVFKLGAALMAGCTLVVKPADATPLSTLKLAAVFKEAGLPPHVLNVVTGDKSVGEMLVAHKTPRKIAFTGSVPAGKAIAAAAATTMKRVTLELGGQSAAIVCDDADLEKAATAICRHSFANSGQFCYRVARVYVALDVYNDFLTRLVTKVKQLTVGVDGDLGPLINQRMFENSMRHIEDATRRGARLLCGGERLSGAGFDGGYFLPPTVLADCAADSLVMRTETFGPVLGIAPFTTTAEAVHAANDTPFGLAGFVFSANAEQGRSICHALEAGTVWLNDIQRSSHHMPFGGVKESGLGREKGRWGIEAYYEWKTIYEQA
jgi:succinate-semialdehyde dehydrogenase / glutarate-semialdehyde dehydrogenase